MVDTGLPRSWDSLQSALAKLGRSAGDIEAVVLTHGHFDHMGFARRAHEELGVPVWAHRDELSVVSHPWRYDHERSRLPYFRHPHGHCPLAFADRGAVIAGDALVTLDPYTGRAGPCVVAGAATADSGQALSSLDALAGLDATTALTGHGPAWKGSMRGAVERAQAAGAA